MTDSTAPAIEFPFERERTYNFGALRDFEIRLLAARQADPDLSALWRVPPAALKQAAKVREETYPLMLLADAKVWPDEAKFRLTPYGAPMIDVDLWVNGVQSRVQITTAYPIWLEEGGKPRNGGYDHRLVLEALNHKGVIHGHALMQRQMDDIVSGKVVASTNEEFNACVRGVEGALRTKIAAASGKGRLLVHFRRDGLDGVDFPFSRIADSAFDRIGRREIDRAFAAYYFVGEGPAIFFEHAR